MRMSEKGTSRITYLAQTDFRNQRRIFGILDEDRRSHIYIIGKTGTGKTTLLKNMIRQDMEDGAGLALLDPHGDLIEELLGDIPLCRKNEVIYLNAPEGLATYGFNPLSNVVSAKRSLVAAGLLNAFQKIWLESWGPRLEHVLRNALLALLEQPNATLADILCLLDDSLYRKLTAGRVANAQVRRFWLKEYESYPARFRSEIIAPLQNKVGALLSHPVLYAILTQNQPVLDLRSIMDQKRILLVNLSKGKIGIEAARLLGSLLVSSLETAALSRADRKEEERTDFYLYLDEFQNVTTLSLAAMLAELRKYRVSLTLAHQHLTQLDPVVRDAIFGNVGTLIAFRVGLSDADLLAKEFYPEFSLTDLIGLPNHHIYLKLMIEGKISKPFSAVTLKPD